MRCLLCLLLLCLLCLLLLHSMIFNSHAFSHRKWLQISDKSHIRICSIWWANIYQEARHYQITVEIAWVWWAFTLRLLIWFTVLLLCRGTLRPAAFAVTLSVRVCLGFSSNALGPQEDIPQALTLTTEVRFIAGRLRHPFLVEFRLGPRYFWTHWGCVSYGPALSLTLKKGLWHSCALGGVLKK